MPFTSRRELQSRLRSKAVWFFILLAAYCLTPGDALQRAASKAGTPAAPSETGAVLSLQDRVAYQRAVEEVYWRHTVWPEAGGAKPGLAAVMPPDATRAKVEDALRKSDALARLWRQEVTGAMLQAELDRMARRTKRPEVLGELFSALDNDPFLIAEVLARPLLVDRLARNAYAYDERLRGPTPARAAAGGGRQPSFDSWWQSARGGFEARVAPAKAAYTLPASAPAAPGADDTWRPMSALPVAAGTAVWTGVEMIVWGGGTDSGSRYNPATDTWTPTSTINAPSSRGRHTAIWTGAEMIVWGGCNLSGSFCGESTGGRYDPRTDTWTPTSNVDAPSGRREHTAVWTGAEMIVWGGCRPGYVGSCNRVGGGGGGAYNPATDSWRAISSLGAPEGRTKHTAVWTGREMIVWGGVATNITNTGGRYNPATDSWLPTSLANAPAPRMEHTAVWTGSVMVVWGARDGNGMAAFNTGGRYDPANDSWTPTSLAGAPPARIGHTAVWTGTEMIVWGGDLRFSLGYTNTGGRYRPDTDTWAPTNQAGAPGPRADHVAVWTGSEMIVWSTADGKSGGRYDPARDSWRPTNNRDSSPSVYHGVWTGAEMIVWGAHPGCLSGCPSAGGRYDPATDAWRPINLAGGPRAPDRDQRMTAVWTGTEMIVWGMSDGVAGSPGEGGRYNPATDSWSPVTKTNAPANRNWHTAVWTGAEMVVWGGQDNQGALLDDGGRYDPAADTWRPTNAAGAPEARNMHTAVWTGREMIVWGGVGPGFAHLNSGGRYDPAADAWRPTALNNAPVPRRAHTAVWTGAEMIVWGGRDGDYSNNTLIYDTGGRYDPAADTWRPTNAAGAPLARFNHTAVWTGSLMIVWGGLAQTGVAQREVSTGARYDPAGDAWRPTARPRAPSARSSHVAVWTGQEMLIWGGDRSPYTGAETHGAAYTAPGAPTPTPTPTPTPPPTTPTTPALVNHALSANGATAAASSVYSSARQPAAAINGDRRGVNGAAGDPATGSWWADATYNAFPDWVEVRFAGQRTVERVDLFTSQDNLDAPAEPTPEMTFTKYGATAFRLEYWTGSAWAPIPGGSVTGNNKVWRSFSFAPLVTDRVRVVVNHAAGGHSRVAELEAWGPAPTSAPAPARLNVAAASNGATAAASSVYNSTRPAASAINGERTGLGGTASPSSAGNWWADATYNSFPDRLEVSFAGARSITEVSVFSVQDGYATAAPTEATTFTQYGLQDFDVEYWNGSAWALVPGGGVVGNNRVWRKVTFPAVTTTKVRVTVKKALAGHSRIAEVEAY